MNIQTLSKKDRLVLLEMMVANQCSSQYEEDCWNKLIQELDERQIQQLMILFAKHLDADANQPVKNIPEYVQRKKTNQAQIVALLNTWGEIPDAMKLLKIVENAHIVILSREQLRHYFVDDESLSELLSLLTIPQLEFLKEQILASDIDEETKEEIDKFISESQEDRFKLEMSITKNYQQNPCEQEEDLSQTGFLLQLQSMQNELTF